jgi:tetratricopeptide (TPR) repeat protein
MSKPSRLPLLNQFYQQYLADQDAGALADRVREKYSLGTLERLAHCGQRITRRAAVLAIGLLGDYGSNGVLGQALSDPDRGVRLLADNSIRNIWCRFGSDEERRKLATVIRLNGSRRYGEVIRLAGELIQRLPSLAETWNQRAIAFFHTARYAESIRDCQQALEINPYHFGAATGMGQCYMHLNDPTAALECFRRALRLNPNLEGVRAQINHLQRSLKAREEGHNAGEL